MHAAERYTLARAHLRYVHTRVSRRRLSRDFHLPSGSVYRRAEFTATWDGVKDLLPPPPSIFWAWSAPSSMDRREYRARIPATTRNFSTYVCIVDRGFVRADLQSFRYGHKLTMRCLVAFRGNINAATSNWENVTIYPASPSLTEAIVLLSDYRTRSELCALIVETVRDYWIITRVS